MNKVFLRATGVMENFQVKTLWEYLNLEKSTMLFFPHEQTLMKDRGTKLPSF